MSAHLSMNTIVVADGQPLYRAGLVATLHNYRVAKVIREEADFPGVLASLAAAPDTRLVSIDLELPGMGALSGVRRLRSRHPAVKVVVVDWPEAQRAVFDALAAGAHGYVPKQHSPSQMAAGFQAVLKGNIYVPASVCDEPSPPCDSSRRDGQPQLLTRRQREVLTLLTTGRSNKEIARALMISESTVKVHLAAAFRLLGVRSRMAAATALRGFAAAAGSDGVDPSRHHPK
ncbi:DNA-binding response regulator [Brevundimonas naejangsanensis]|uniref:DNA-binding response regulator n=1 Tax=Brevundimonas naejangsanensis TaxID=588932 RepID=A0A494RGW1_9CAUL|nr:response regulator transcription factor [Brevundimonas naejangsanensis]AYG95665.1 DNA-binding response regulator [Brevundimonas naejangsanensis]